MQANQRESCAEIAEAVRQACIEAAKKGFREASMSGLCMEGAQEAAVSAMQLLDIDSMVNRQSD